MRVLVVDDEPLARDKLRLWLGEEDDIECVWECGNGFEALELLGREAADLVFLDIQMPGMDGFEMLDHLEKRPAVVFVTAYDRYAIAAFEQHALDYLLKPYDRPRFAVALERARGQHELQRRGAVDARLEELLAAARPQRGYTRRFAVRQRERILLLDAEEVDWLEAKGNYVALHAGSAEHLVRDSLGKIAERTEPGLFIRIHRSTLVNSGRIRELRPASHGDYIVVLHDGHALTMSRTYSDSARHALGL